VNAAICLLPNGADNEIIRAVVDLAVERFTRELRSVVLAGSLARDEGTWRNVGSHRHLAGDAEFLLVFRDPKSLPSTELTERLCRDAEAKLVDRQIDARIDLSPVGPEFLHCQRPHIFAFELITNGKVVWGDKQILNLVPAFTPADIPLEDGYRILLNRMTELLEALCEPEDGAMFTDAINYRSMKLSLDMATSFLLFEGVYEPTYRARARRLMELSERSAPCPVPLGGFAERVQIATQRKLGEEHQPGIPRFADLRELIDDLHLLWRWELEKLTSSRPHISDRELMNRWIIGQPPIERFRGWASVARRYGATRCLGQLPHWARQALRGSPRRLLYAAASDLMFAMPEILYASGQIADNRSRWDQLRMNLPVREPPDLVHSASDWRRVGSTIAWNYHHFLKSTRS
jgi:hypothetical protein